MKCADIDPAFGNWFAGFADGEGSFMIISRKGVRGYNCRFVLSLRADDGAVLREIASRIGAGSINYVPTPQKHPTQKPQWRFEVNTKAGCLRLIEVLDRFPLRAKKTRDYAIWRRAVLAHQRISRRGPQAADWTEIEALKAALHEIKEFESPEFVPMPFPSPRQLTLEER